MAITVHAWRREAFCSSVILLRYDGEEVAREEIQDHEMEAAEHPSAVVRERLLSMSEVSGIDLRGLLRLAVADSGVRQLLMWGRTRKQDARPREDESVTVADAADEIVRAILPRAWIVEDRGR